VTEGGGVRSRDGVDQNGLSGTCLPGQAASSARRWRKNATGKWPRPNLPRPPTVR